MNEIITGDSLQVLKTLENETVDLVCTDPPYGYSFMGKDWDKAVPGVDIWKECLRVLKPGAFAFVMSAPRQDVLSQMIVRLGMAGFDTSFTSIYWTYASGFPKAANVGKLVDKKLGAEREVVDRIRPDGKAPGKVVTGFDGFSLDAGKTLGPAVTPQAKALDGSYAGFQPKPAVEVVIVAMKPLSEKTYVDQALANGKGVTWLDDCRIPHNGENLGGGGEKRCSLTDKDGWDRPWMHDKDAQQAFADRIKERVAISETRGRFPANLLVSDDVLNGEQEYSRYFDLDKWAEKTLPFLIVPKASKSEKDKGLEDMPEQNAGSTQFASRGFGELGGHKHLPVKARNNHPTVKPLKLMSYLITMGSRPNDVILDPFSGSGTTCIAAKQLGRQYLGIELSEEYATIARKRLDAVPAPISSYSH